MHSSVQSSSSIRTERGPTMIIITTTQTPFRAVRGAFGAPFPGTC